MSKNRGKELENRVNITNMNYRKDKKAIIYKIELPLVLTKKGPKIKKSTVDYIGSIGPDGLAVAFDAKETKNKTSFPLNNVHDHQLEFLSYWGDTGGISALFIWFKEVDKEEGFFTPIDFIVNFIKNNKRKSIPYKDFDEDWKVPITDYLSLYE